MTHSREVYMHAGPRHKFFIGGANVQFFKISSPGGGILIILTIIGGGLNIYWGGTEILLGGNISGGGQSVGGGGLAKIPASGGGVPPPSPPTRGNPAMCILNKCFLSVKNKNNTVSFLFTRFFQNFLNALLMLCVYFWSFLKTRFFNILFI